MSTTYKYYVMSNLQEIKRLEIDIEALRNWLDMETNLQSRKEISRQIVIQQNLLRDLKQEVNAVEIEVVDYIIL